jgi:hypothetical protein
MEIERQEEKALEFPALLVLVKFKLGLVEIFIHFRHFLHFFGHSFSILTHLFPTFISEFPKIFVKAKPPVKQ